MAAIDLLIIISSISLCILFLLLTRLPQAFLTLRKASFIGLDLTLSQAIKIVYHKCNTDNFLLCLKDIWKVADFPLDDLIVHYYAKEDLNNLRDGIIEMKIRKGEIDFSILTALDLADRDLIEEIRKAALNNWRFAHQVENH